MDEPSGWSVVVEFVSLVSSEANDVSGREKRNTIHPDHVIKALQELGLQEFVEEVTAAWDVWKEESKCRPTGADMLDEASLAVLCNFHGLQCSNDC